MPRPGACSLASMWRWFALAMNCLVVGSLAVLVGSSAANAVLWRKHFESPAARVSWRMDRTKETNGKQWPSLDEDLRAMNLRPPADDALRLVLALRGVDQGGLPNWRRAEQLCRGLGWPRCDRAALERMKAMP